MSTDGSSKGRTFDSTGPLLVTVYGAHMSPTLVYAAPMPKEPWQPWPPPPPGESTTSITFEPAKSDLDPDELRKILREEIERMDLHTAFQTLFQRVQHLEDQITEVNKRLLGLLEKLIDARSSDSKKRR